jgi:uncharacterized protein (TIGR00156 family)
MALTTQQIQKAYIAFFNRPADVSGLKNWLQHTGDDADLLNVFSQSKEYTDLFTGKTPEEVVTKVYKNLFAREPDTGGLQHWVNSLKAGAVTISNIAHTILNSAGPGDDKTIAAKLEAAEQFTKTLEADLAKSAAGYETGGAAAGAAVRSWFSQIGESGSRLESTLKSISEVSKKLTDLVKDATQPDAPSTTDDGAITTTVANASVLPDDTKVHLQGRITSALGDGKYLFHDGTGEIVIELDPSHDFWRSMFKLSDTSTTTIEFSGEVDVGQTGVEIDVYRLVGIEVTKDVPEIL